MSCRGPELVSVMLVDCCVPEACCSRENNSQIPHGAPLMSFSSSEGTQCITCSYRNAIDQLGSVCCALLTHLLLLLLLLWISPQVTEVPPLSAEANAVLDQLATGFSVEDALQVRISG